MSALSDAITFTSAALRMLTEAQDAEDATVRSDGIQGAREALTLARLHAGRANLATRIPSWDQKENQS